MSGTTDAQQEFRTSLKCARPGCYNDVQQPIGRGRRRGFCSDICRRSAERDYKRAKSLVEAYEDSLERTRHEVASYGRRGPSGDATEFEDETLSRARIESALARAEGVIKYAPADSDVPYLDDLRELVEALRPFVALGARRATA